MNLGGPAPKYDPANEAQMRRALETEDRRNRKTDQDIDLRDLKIFIRSPNGHRWYPEIDNAGSVTWTDLDA